MRGIISRPGLSLYALSSFTISYVAARSFTSINPDIILVGGGYHIHHFWYGLALIALGGWLGINYTGETIDRFAATLFGLGGGLVVDEVGLLLTLGNYYASISYTAFVVIIMIASGGILLSRYREQISLELRDAVKNRVFIRIAFALAFVSSIYLISSSSLITAGAVCLMIGAAALVIAHSYLSLRGRVRRNG